MFKFAWFLPTLLWFASLAIEWLMPSVLDPNGRYSRVEFLFGLLQIPGLIFGTASLVRDKAAHTITVVLVVCALLGIATFVGAVAFVSSIH